MPGEDISQVEPHPGQVGWADDSIEIMDNPGEDGQGDGLPQEGDVYAPGGPQQEHDVRAEGGRGVPRVIVYGLIDNQDQPVEEFGRINIKKLISNWDAMAGEEVPEQPGVRGGEGVDNGRGRSLSESHSHLKRQSSRGASEG